MRSLVPRFTPWLVLITLTAAGVAAAVGYDLTAAKRYRATAQLLVSPVSASEPTFTGIDVLRDTGGKRTAAASAAALLRSPQVADAVRAQLGITRSRESLLRALDARVVDGSDVVAVTVEDTSANSAAQLANAFADALINQRSATFQFEVASAIRRDGQLLAAVPKAQPPSAAAAELERRLAVLRSLQGLPDPTLKRSSQATAPTAASWPKLSRLVEIGGGIGAAAGALLALTLVALRRRRGPTAGQYDRPMTDEALETFVDRLEGRLAARESGLAARERDLQAKLDELRAALASAAAPADDADLVRRGQELDERVATLTKRELELARRAAELARREREAAAREAAEQGAAEQAEAEQAAAEQAAAEQAAPEPAPEPAPVLAAAPPLSVDGSPGRYNLLSLERIVEERGAEFPDRVEEWSSYLFFLRDHASADGAVPPSFDWLIQDTFGELVD